MKIGGFLTLSTIDYPGKLAAAVFTQGCNFRCPYCHNSTLIPFESNEYVDPEYVLSVLKKRKTVLEGVVVTGGEPTLQEDLLSFVQLLKTLGYEVKVDTNGSRPEVLEELVVNDLVDYVAVDFKSWRSGYERLSNDVCALDKVLRSVDLLSKHSIPMEIRTTCDKRFVDVDTIRTMSLAVKQYQNLVWFLQKARSPGRPCQNLDELVNVARENVRYVYCRE